MSTKKHRLRECPHTHSWVPPFTYKGPCTGMEAERRIKPMVLPWVDGSLMLEIDAFPQITDG